MTATDAPARHALLIGSDFYFPRQIDTAVFRTAVVTYTWLDFRRSARSRENSFTLASARYWSRGSTAHTEKRRIWKS